jgi:hypothetical protein
MLAIPIMLLNSFAAMAYTRDARLDSNSIAVSYGETYTEPGIRPIQKTLISRISFEKALNEDWSFGFLVQKDMGYGQRQDLWFVNLQDEESKYFEWSFNRSITKGEDFSACWIFGIYQSLDTSAGNALKDWAFMPEIGVALTKRIYGPLLFRSNLVLSNLFSMGVHVGLPGNVDFGVDYSYYSIITTAFPVLASMSYKF